MPQSTHDVWSDRLEEALAGYAPELVRAVATRLLKTRSQWPVDELIERIRDASTNAPLIDRRLKDLPPTCRKLLALIGLSRRPNWKIPHLLTMLATLGHVEGITPIVVLLEEGLLFPVRSEGVKLKTVQQWLVHDKSILTVFAHPFVAQRARSEDLDLPELKAVSPSRPDVRESDGLEFPLRLAVVWQQVLEAPLRRTQQLDFFKRDFQRLGSDQLLNAPFAESLVEIPDAGLLAVAWALSVGLLREEDAALHVGTFSSSWRAGLSPTLAELWQALPDVEAWSPVYGWRPVNETPNPFPSAHLLILLILARQGGQSWVRIDDVEQWLVGHHPHWAGTVGGARAGWGKTLIAGLFFQLRIVQCATGPKGDLLVRLTSFGRWLASAEHAARPQTEFPQALIVQANFEILAFRQGLTPDLIAQLSQFAHWRSIGTACLLGLNAEQVYRGLEYGLSFDDMRQLLQRHSLRPVPENVLDALRTWANKRERVVVYENATLIEFASPADLDAAVARGLVEVRVTERIGLVRDENAVEYRHFRLTGTRDYGAKVERCITVADDGVTLRIDAARADLLLDSELGRVAEPANSNGDAGSRVYRLTRATLRRALENGWSLPDLDDWLTQRAGVRLSPAARLLAVPDASTSFQLERCLVLHAPTDALADGLMQWAGTRDLIRTRLGPTALLVAEEDVPRLREQMTVLQQALQAPDLP